MSPNLSKIGPCFHSVARLGFKLIFTSTTQHRRVRVKTKIHQNACTVVQKSTLRITQFLVKYDLHSVRNQYQQSQFFNQISLLKVHLKQSSSFGAVLTPKVVQNEAQKRLKMVDLNCARFPWDLREDIQTRCSSQRCFHRLPRCSFGPYIDHIWLLFSIVLSCPVIIFGAAFPCKVQRTIYIDILCPQFRKPPDNHVTQIGTLQKLSDAFSVSSQYQPIDSTTSASRAMSSVPRAHTHTHKRTRSRVALAHAYFRTRIRITYQTHARTHTHTHSPTYTHMHTHSRASTLPHTHTPSHLLGIRCQEHSLCGARTHTIKHHTRKQQTPLLITPALFARKKTDVRSHSRTFTFGIPYSSPQCTRGLP